MSDDNQAAVAMPTLYHSPLSVTSQKVRMTLAEKGVAWTDMLVDLMVGEQYGEAFTRINEYQQVPVLVHGDCRLLESTLICEYVNEAFPGIALLAPDPMLRYQSRAWVQWIAAHVHIPCGVITYAVLVRPMAASWTQETRGLLLDRAGRAGRQWQINALAAGFDSVEFPRALAKHQELFDRMERALTTAHSWLVGANISLADIAAFPYVMRADHIGLSELFDMSTHPNLRAWYMRMMTRPSVLPSFVRYVDAPMQRLMMELVLAAQPQFQEVLSRCRSQAIA